MAVLRSTQVHGEADPKIAFGLELLGLERASDGEQIKDWRECRLWIEIFEQKIERPGVNTLHGSETGELIQWLREMTKARNLVQPFNTIEPIFQIKAEPIAGPTFTVTVLISAYGVVPGYYVEECGVHVDIPASEAAIMRFAEELESELARVKS
jgi:hypothetical protein